MTMGPGIMLNNPDTLMQDLNMRKTSDPVITGINTMIGDLRKSMDKLSKDNLNLSKSIERLNKEITTLKRENNTLSHRISQFEPSDVKPNLKLGRRTR